MPANYAPALLYDPACATLCAFRRLSDGMSSRTGGHFEKRVLRMSESVIKGVKRLTPRPATRSVSSASTAKSRKLHAKAARPKPPAKRAGATKPPVRKATKKTGSPAKKASNPAGKATPKTTKGKQPAKLKPAKKAPPAKGRAATKSAKRPAAKPARHAPAAKGRTTKHAAPPTRPQTPPRPAPRPKPSQDEMAAIRAFERAHKDFSRLSNTRTPPK